MTSRAALSIALGLAGAVALVGLYLGLSGLAVFLVEFRTPLMLLGIATNVVGIVVMLFQLRRIRGGYRRLSRRSSSTIRIRFDTRDSIDGRRASDAGDGEDYELSVSGFGLGVVVPEQH